MPFLNPQYSRYVAITKSDAVDFTAAGRGAAGGSILCDAIYVGGAGVVVAVDESGSTCSFTCIAGQILPIKARRVNSTTTTATLMVALYQV